MKNPRPRCIATKALLLMASLLLAAGSWAAQVVGTVTNLSGPLLAKKPDGSAKVLSVKSGVEQGDTLISEKDTYARIKFIDNSEITLRPGTQMKIDDFSFDEEKPEKDNAAFGLVKGGLRAVTGTLGKRNKDKWGLNTPTATIGIRGTTFIAQYVPPPPVVGAPPSVGAPSSGPPSLSPGLHLQVTDGAIIVTNTGGSLGFQAGQFGYVPSVNQPPVIIPSNPGIQFVPPPSFGTGSGGPTASNGPGQGQATDCIVR